MVVVCEGCGTKFNLADGQVPAGGARVRCSKCHHRFVVTPSGAPRDATTRAAAEDSPRPAEGAREEPSLDNPEFLFDHEGDEGDEGDEGGEGAVTQNPDLEETMISEDEVDSSADLGAYDEGDEEEIFGDEPDSQPSLPAPPDYAPDEQMSASEAMEAAPPLEASGSADAEADEFGPEGSILGSETPEAEASPFGSTGEDLAPAEPPVAIQAGDESAGLDDWDPEAGDDPMSSWDDLLDGEGGAGAESAIEPVVARTAARAPVARAAPPRAPEPPQSEDAPRLSTEIVDRASRVGAVVAALLLAVGGVRAVSQHSLGPTPGPDVVRGGGWAAEQIDSLQLRDAAGRRVVVVRGSLTSPSTRNVPPRVRAILLDAAGDPIGPPVDAHLERLSGDQLTPDSLTQRLAAASGRAALPSTGFTILIPEPPVAARRFDLRLEPSS